MSEETRRGVVKFIVGSFVSKAVLTAIVLGAAGSITWIWGWVFAALYLAFDVITVAVLLPRCPELLARRVKHGEGTKGWDKWLVTLAALVFPVLMLVVSGLDHRFGWTGYFPLWAQLGGVVLCAIGYGIVVWSMAANAFFETTVRIQHDRGHTVATGGPYRYVRHPGYVGAILFTVMTALVLGSIWALIPALLSAVTFVVRTALEDRTLREELSGYEAYTKETRYRLLPGIY